MHDKRMGDLIQHLRQIVRPESSNGLGDSELLRRWVGQRDAAAFEVLLWRHAPMVYGVCCRVLRDTHEAEDALQATFLALARKAGSIGRGEAVAGWLYRVAFRASLAAKARTDKWPKSDHARLATLATEPAADFVWKDLRPVLDEEINRLPAKYRVPFVLHYLEGRSNEEVARELGCPVGTVLSRVARARERLRFRLSRRGLTLSVGALAAGLGGNALSATVAPGLIGGLVRAASFIAAGQAPAAGLVTANAATLADAVLRGMFMSKLKTIVVLLLSLSMLGTGTTALAYRLGAGGQPAAGPKPPGQRQSW